MKRITCFSDAVNRINSVWPMSEGEVIEEMSWTLDREEGIIESAEFDGGLTKLVLEGGKPYNEYRLEAKGLTSIGRKLKQGFWVMFLPTPDDEKESEVEAEEVEVLIE